MQIWLNPMELLGLITQAQSLLSQIREHPRFKHLQYSPDLSIADASQALACLQWELEAEGYKIESDRPSDQEASDRL